MSTPLPADPAELLAALRAHVAAAPFNAWAGVEVVEAEPGRVVVAIDARDDFKQVGGHIHAAIQCGLLEVALGLAISTKVGFVAVTNQTTSYVAPAIGERFVATGETVRAGRRQGFATAELHAVAADGTSRLVAYGSALAVPTT